MRTRLFGPSRIQSGEGDRFAARHEELSRYARFVTETGQANGYLRGKYALLADPLRCRRLLGLLRYELGIWDVDVRDATVLDAGCGSGIFSLLLLALGARSIHAIDLFPENIAVLRALREKYDLPIDPDCRDVVRTGLEGDTIDFVYCTEAISHFRDPMGFIAEAARVVRPGGRVLIADGNNGANPVTRARIVADWYRSECGPFRLEDWVDQNQNLPYLYRRWMIIRRAFPQMSDEAVYRLGLATAGMGGDEVLRACRSFCASGVYPEGGYRRGQSQIRPEDGQRNEEPIHPSALVHALRRAGCRARARAHFGFGRSRVLPWVNAAGSLFPSLALRFAPRYLVCGVKHG